MAKKRIKRAAILGAGAVLAGGSYAAYKRYKAPKKTPTTPTPATPTPKQTSTAIGKAPSIVKYTPESYRNTKRAQNWPGVRRDRIAEIPSGKAQILRAKNYKTKSTATRVKNTYKKTKPTTFISLHDSAVRNSKNMTPETYTNKVFPRITKKIWGDWNAGGKRRKSVLGAVIGWKL